jgi:hypothetical protein
MAPNDDAPTSFDRDIKPMFRDKDRTSMLQRFDLWSYSDVSQHADAILGQVSAGRMPCDGRWPDDHVELFRQWMESGKSA